MLDAYDYFQGILHYSGTNCARRLHIEQHAAPILRNESYSLEAVQNGFDTRRDSNLQPIAYEQSAIHKRAILREIENALVFAEGVNAASCREHLDGFSQTREYVTRVRDEVAGYLRDARGVVVSAPSIYVDDRLPEPYGKTGGSVLTADLGDFDRFGISPGIYFTERAMKPVFLEYTVAHELIHCALGDRSPELPATTEEEGVADLLSIADWTRSCFGEDVARNCLRLHRLTSSCGLRWDQYVEAAQKVAVLATFSGVSALYDAINDGRDALSDYLNSTLPIEIRESELDDSISFALREFIMFPRRRVVSDVAFEVALFALPGMTMRELARVAEMSEALCERGVAELERNGLVNRRPDGVVITVSQCAAELSSGRLRYDFREL